MASDTYVIVVALDDSAESELAFERGLQIATRQPGAELHVVAVVEGDSMGRLQGAVMAGRVSLEKDKQKLAGRVDEILARSRQPERLIDQSYSGQVATMKIKRHVLVGPPADEIVGLGEKLDADLVVVGTRGRSGLKRLLLGSVAEGVLRLAKGPVLVVRPKTWSHRSSPP